MLALPASPHTLQPRVALPHLGMLYGDRREGPPHVTKRQDSGHHGSQPSRPPVPLASQPTCLIPLDAPSPCCCLAEGRHPQGAWGPRSLDPRPPAPTSPPAGPVRKTPGLGALLGSTPQGAQTANAGHTPMAMWVGLQPHSCPLGRALEVSSLPRPVATSGPRLHPSQYLGLGLLHPVLRRK